MTTPTPPPSPPVARAPPDEEAQPAATEPSASDVADAARAVRAFGMSMIIYADALPTLPSRHLAGAVRNIEQLLFRGKPAARARLSLLACIDAVAADRSNGSGLRDLFLRHFPELGSERDLKILEDRRSTAYRDFAKQWVKWLYAGPFTDVRPHQSLSFSSLLGELMEDGEGLVPKSEARPPGEPWRPEPIQSAFVVAATFHVGNPNYGERLMTELGQVADVLALWQPNMPGKWPAAVALAESVGLGGVKRDTLRNQWDEHEANRVR